MWYFPLPSLLLYGHCEFEVALNVSTTYSTQPPNHYMNHSSSCFHSSSNFLPLHDQSPVVIHTLLHTGKMISFKNYTAFKRSQGMPSIDMIVLYCASSLPPLLPPLSISLCFYFSPSLFSLQHPLIKQAQKPSLFPSNKHFLHLRPARFSQNALLD